jgi:carbamoyltransferase
VHGVSECTIATLGKVTADWDVVTAQRNQHYADIAASIPRVTEQTLLKISNCAHKRTGPKKLCRVREALSSVANGRIPRESPFEDVFI